jgi:replicative DNA helicase
MIASNATNPSDDLPAGSHGEDFCYSPVKSPTAGRVMLRDFLTGLLDDVLTGEPPPEYHFDSKPWGTLALRPRQITCIGGAPNCGKTALLMKMVTGALVLDPNLRAVIANVEMSELILAERMLARLSGVYLGKILKRDRDSFFADRINAVRPQLESLADRLMFVRRPFTMVDVRAVCDEFQPHIVALDYLQRIPADSRLVELRQQVTLTMTATRELADQGPAVLLAAALNRQASSKAQSRAEATDDNANDLAAFRDSSDVEYSADDAYVLAKAPGNTVTLSEGDYQPKKLILRHVKSRNSLTMHIPLTFDGRVQEFTLRKLEDTEGHGTPRIATPTSMPVRKKMDGFFDDPFLDNLKEGDGGTTWLS